MLDQSVHQSLGKICILCAYLNKLCISHANFPWTFWSSEGMANENRKDKIAESEGFCLPLLSLLNWKCCVRIQPYPVISVWKSVILCSNLWKRMENLCEILKIIKVQKHPKFRESYVPHSCMLLCKQLAFR